MAKLYQIKFSDKGKLSDLAKSEKDATKTTCREIELLALESLLSVAAANMKEIKKVNECYDVIDQIKNLQDDKLELNLSKTDLEYVEKGLELSAGQRPGAWYYARDMFKSIEKPVEIEV